MTPNEENDNPYVRVLHRDPLYLLSEWDIEKIDGLVSALSVALSEIFAGRAVRQDPFAETPAQEDFQAQVDAVTQEEKLAARRKLPLPKP